MGKLTSLILGIIAIEVLVYYIISNEYSSIINWFGPIFGFRIIMMLGFLALFFGNPLSYISVSGSWVIVGLVVALGSRRTLRSIGAAVSVFFLSLTLFVLVLASFLFSGGQLSSLLGGSQLASFPPPPPGSSIGQILSSPVISSLVGFLTPLLSLAGLPSGTTSPVAGGSGITSIVLLFIGPLIGNFLILITSAGVFGYLFSRFILKNKTGKKKGVTAAAVILISAMMAVSLFAVIQGGQPDATSTPHFQGSIATQSVQGDFSGLENTIHAIPDIAGIPYAASASGYYEGIISYVSGDGSVYNAYGFASASNSTPSPAFYNMPGIDSSALTALVGDANLASFFLGIPGFNISVLSSPEASTLLNLVPQEAFIQVFPGSLSETSAVAAQSAASLESGMSLQLTSVLSLSVPVNSSTTSNASIYLYTASAGYSSFLNGFYGYSVSGFHPSGLLDVFKAKYNEGALNPSGTDMAGSIVFSAMINFNTFRNIFGTSGPFGSLANNSNYLSIVGGMTVNNYAIHSDGGISNITLARTLGYNSPIFFAPDSTASLLALGTPTLAGNSTLFPGLNFTAYISGMNNTFFSNMGLNSTTLPGYNPSTGIAPAHMQTSTSWLFPPDVALSITGNRMPDGSVEIYTTVKNNGTVPIYNFRLDDTSFQKFYGNYTSSEMGNLSMHTPLISPGQVVNNTYSFRPTGVGAYVLWNMTENYVAPVGNGSQNESFQIAVVPVQVNVGSPFFLAAYHQIAYDSVLSIGSYLNFTYFTIALLPGLYLFDIVLGLIVALDIYIELRAFKGFMERRKETPNS